MAEPQQGQGHAIMEEPGIGDISPVVPAGTEKEPMLLLDTTGSMSYSNDEADTFKRMDIIGEAIGTVVEKLGAEDSQAAAEAAAGEDAGGVMTVTFADGNAENIGDLSTANWREKWSKIQWGGNTYIMPGWELLVKTYQDEFGTEGDDRPDMLGLIITDGEANDTDEFAAAIAQATNKTHVVIALLGYGDEHDRALATYQEIAAANTHVRVVTFGNQTDPATISRSVLSLVA